MATKKTKDKILSAYKDYVLTHGQKPNSVYAFCKDLKIKESDFYEFFRTFEQIESDYLASVFMNTYDNLKNDEQFQAYSVREKVLSILFTHFQELTEDRSFIVALSSQKSDLKEKMGLWKSYRHEVIDAMEQVLAQAGEEDNIPNRPLLSARYKDMLWLNVSFVFHFWLKDDSKGFENTDACIEKSVNLTLDLLQKNTLDHAIDFGKFIFQSMKK